MDAASFSTTVGNNLLLLQSTITLNTENEFRMIHGPYINQTYIYIHIKKVKWSRCMPGVAQRVGRGIALLFHDRGTRRGWVVSSTPQPHFTSGKDPVPIVQEAGWAPGPVWMDGKSRPHRDSSPDRPDRSQLLYRLSYPAHNIYIYTIIAPTNAHMYTKFVHSSTHVYIGWYQYFIHIENPISTSMKILML